MQLAPTILTEKVFDNHVQHSGSLGAWLIYLMFTIVVEGCEYFNIRAMMTLFKMYECNKMASKLITMLFFPLYFLVLHSLWISLGNL